MKVEIQGDLCVASGKNWKYEQCGDLKVFTQTGKVPSLRVIRTAIKLIGSISIPTHKTDRVDFYGDDGNLIFGGGGGGMAGYSSGISGGRVGNGIACFNGNNERQY